MIKKTTDNNGRDNQNDNNTPDRLIPIKLWPQYHPWPPEGGLRHIRFFSEKKNACHCFVKKGGRVLIRERTFLEWASTSDAA
jgi:hypothetical protein